MNLNPLISDLGWQFITSIRKIILKPTCLAFVGLCILYYFIPEGSEGFPLFLLIYSLQFVVYFHLTSNSKRSPLTLKNILIIATLSRLILIFTSPILENDYWRYLWDGRVLAHGINPYLFSPMNEALDHLDVFYRKAIGWSEYRTIYPPISILLFSISHILAPDSFIGIKIALTAFEVMTVVVTLMWLKELKLPMTWVGLYLLNPLALKEIANSAHLDSIAMFFSMLAAFLLWKGLDTNLDKIAYRLSAWVCLGLAVGSKIYPLIFAPLFFKLDRTRNSGLIALAATLLIIYLPFTSAREALFSGSLVFAGDWLFNAGLYRVVEELVTIALSSLVQIHLLATAQANALLDKGLLAKVISAATVGLFTMYRAHKLVSRDRLPNEIVNATGALLLFSSVVNAWYLLWLLPFLCITRQIPWVAFSYLVIASYAWWYSTSAAVYMRWVEYMIFFIFLFFYYKINLFRSAKALAMIKE